MIVTSRCGCIRVEQATTSPRSGRRDRCPRRRRSGSGSGTAKNRNRIVVEVRAPPSLFGSTPSSDRTSLQQKLRSRFAAISKTRASFGKVFPTANFQVSERSMLSPWHLRCSPSSARGGGHANLSITSEACACPRLGRRDTHTRTANYRGIANPWRTHDAKDLASVAGGPDRASLRERPRATGGPAEHGHCQVFGDQQPWNSDRRLYDEHNLSCSHPHIVCERHWHEHQQVRLCVRGARSLRAHDGGT